MVGQLPSCPARRAAGCKEAPHDTRFLAVVGRRRRFAPRSSGDASSRTPIGFCRSARASSFCCSCAICIAATRSSCGRVWVGCLTALRTAAFLRPADPVLAAALAIGARGGAELPRAVLVDTSLSMGMTDGESTASAGPVSRVAARSSQALNGIRLPRPAAQDPRCGRVSVQRGFEAGPHGDAGQGDAAIGAPREERRGEHGERIPSMPALRRPIGPNCSRRPASKRGSARRCGS